MWLLFLIFTFIIEHGFLILCITASLGLIIGTLLAVKFNKRKKDMENELSGDPRFLNSGTFNAESGILVKLSEKGFIGIVDHFTGKTKIIDIKNVTGYELQIDENKFTVHSKGIIGTIFGAPDDIERKVNSIKVILKLNNFYEPVIEIPFLLSEINTDSEKFRNIQNEITQFTGTLEYFLNKK